MVDVFATIAWIVLIWAWGYPERVGKWLAKCVAGFRAHADGDAK